MFDLDGTLIDSYAAIAMALNASRRAFGEAPLSDDEVRRRVGHGLESLVEEVLGADRVEEGVRIFRETYDRVAEAHTRILPGVEATLGLLARRGVALAVASNKPARFGRRLLESLGIAGSLAAIEGPDTAGTPKPHPAMIERCLAAMAVSPSAAVYVGDMALDVESAARAGLPVVLVAGGSSPEAELRATGQVVLRAFEELSRLIPAT